MSERVSIPDRLTLPVLRPTLDRLPTLPMVTSPLVAETHTDGRGVTYSAGVV